MNMKVVTGREDWWQKYGNEINAPKTERPPLFTTASSLADKEIVDLDWLIGSMIPANTVTLLSGDGGTGKSLLALNLAISVACGGKLTWLGYKPDQGKALYIGAEDDMNEMHRRINRMCIVRNGVEYSDLNDLHLASLSNRDALLSTVDPKTNMMYPTELFNDIVTKIDAERPRVVILDTLADLYAGNENDRAQSRMFIGQLRKVSVDYQTTIVLLSHPSLTGMASGSGTSGNTAWSNSVRSRLYMQRVKEDGYEPDKSARKLTVMKSNYGESGTEILMHYVDGFFEAEATSDALDRRSIDSKADRIYLQLLALHTQKSMRLSPNPSANNSACTVFGRSDEREGITKKQFAAAQDRLQLRDEIHVEEEGPPSRRVKYIMLGAKL